MMRVLEEQSVASRSRRGASRRRAARPSGRARSQSIGRRRSESRSRILTGIRTAFLTVAVAALAGGLVWLVPRLEEASGVVEGDVELATSPGLPSLNGGLVEFELTEDLEYIVGDGETLSEIARRFDLTYRELAEYNGIADPNTIVAGQVIVVPGTFSRRLATDSDE